MRNRALHDALRNFALESAARLVRATEAGAEIEFALDEGNEGSATLYRYRPLTAEFIAARWLELRGLPGFEPAARSLGTGTRAYLRRRGEPGAVGVAVGDVGAGIEGGQLLFARQRQRAPAATAAALGHAVAPGHAV